MLSAYFDAAGHESDQPFLVVAGFVSSPTDWQAFDRLWVERLSRDGIEFFHMVEFAHSTGQFKVGWKGENKRRESLLGDLMGIIKSHVYRKFVSVVEVKTLQSKITEEVRRNYHIKAYSLAGRTCAARLREWLETEHWQTELELVFEEGDLGKEALIRRLTTDGFPRPFFKSKKALDQGCTTPLQAADFLAYEVFLATKRLSEERWAIREFSQMVGPMGIYEAKNLETLDEGLTKLDDMVLKLE